MYFGMAEKYHVVGRYGGHNWHGFGSRIWMHENNPSQYKARLARLFEANSSIKRYSKTHI